ncbi:hypothetical protein [Mesorhizobium retamae]|uniref:Uncharacterized protein n=1 Tax=Mesorhizobium retamae TaxID=2912854 RepID=A0ABS9QHY5_9HYPH|nr:hypothetical protein [Mesorhizobium sp. IRAMC:0171]MCG7507067.1 hypothetical protein [Mesorhizobium sp. IRAMC:0171]
MQVRMLVGISGPHYLLNPGDEYQFPADEALRLIEAGFAVPVVETTIETATRIPDAERRGRKRNVADAKSGDAANG